MKFAEKEDIEKAGELMSLSQTILKPYNSKESSEK